MTGFSYIVNGISIPYTYGAIAFDGAFAFHEDMFYIYTSSSNISNIYQPRISTTNDVIDYVMVMPGYKLIVYEHIYSGTAQVIDNYSGTTPLVALLSNSNTATSWKLYFNNDNNEITEII